MSTRRNKNVRRISVTNLGENFESAHAIKRSCWWVLKYVKRLDSFKGQILHVIATCYCTIFFMSYIMQFILHYRICCKISCSSIFDVRLSASIHRSSSCEMWNHDSCKRSTTSMKYSSFIVKARVDITIFRRNSTINFFTIVATPSKSIWRFDAWFKMTTCVSY